MKFGLSDNVIKELHDVFRQYTDIEKVLIFGSRSKGNYRDGSDIDLAVVGKNLDYQRLLAISTALDDIGLLYKIDLIDYNKSIGTPVGDHISRVGQLFYQCR